MAEPILYDNVHVHMTLSKTNIDIVLIIETENEHHCEAISDFGP